MHTMTIITKCFWLLQNTRLDVMRDERWIELSWVWDLLDSVWGWAEFDAGTCWLPVSYFGMSNNIPHNCRRRRRRTVCNGNANRGTTYSYCRLESRERERERETRRVAAGCSSRFPVRVHNLSPTWGVISYFFLHLENCNWNWCSWRTLCGDKIRDREMPLINWHLFSQTNWEYKSNQSEEWGLRRHWLHKQKLRQFVFFYYTNLKCKVQWEKLESLL